MTLRALQVLLSIGGSRGVGRHDDLSVSIRQPLAQLARVVGTVGEVALRDRYVAPDIADPDEVMRPVRHHVEREGSANAGVRA
ncbi:hypothetical protein [Roseitranquillus sediminis]|uniref:hypothetical protein n=1 Tax=Roseitranquillus sediminis TaxID=2809051 RepID=UPI001D0C5223|nr:hypothetical protein [Roseitranquillus sediminis]MBM9595231.1 hypothetical protein [Roseitranquillus sediminis]